MKTHHLIMIIAMGFQSGITLANTLENESVIHDTTTAVNVPLNLSTVLCSRADYGASHLKVLIPELAGLTVLDHRNFGAGAPCVSAGPCSLKQNVNDVLDVNRNSETVPVRVVLKRVTTLNDLTGQCVVSLVENIETTIRGKKFLHQREVVLGERLPEDCNSQ